MEDFLAEEQVINGLNIQAIIKHGFFKKSCSGSGLVQSQLYVLTELDYIPTQFEANMFKAEDTPKKMWKTS